MNNLKGKKGYFAVKMDLGKAYDMLNSKFMEEVLKELRIPTEHYHGSYHHC